MTLEQQIREKQDNIAQLMTARDKAVSAIQNDIYVSWNSYQSRIDTLQRTGSLNAHDQATAIKGKQQSDFQTLGAKKMQLEAEFETQLNREYQAIRALQEEKKLTDEQQKAEDKARYEAKLKEMQEREEANRREMERRQQLTEEQRKAEDKARHEAKLKEMQDRDRTHQRQSGRDRDR